MVAILFSRCYKSQCQLHDKHLQSTLPSPTVTPMNKYELDTTQKQASPGFPGISIVPFRDIFCSALFREAGHEYRLGKP